MSMLHTSFLEKKFGKKVLEANQRTSNKMLRGNQTINYGNESNQESNYQFNFETVSVDQECEEDTGTRFTSSKEFQKIKENPMYQLDYEYKSTEPSRFADFKPSAIQKKLVPKTSEIIEKSRLRTKYEPKQIHVKSVDPNKPTITYGGRIRRISDQNKGIQPLTEEERRIINESFEPL